MKYFLHDSSSFDDEKVTEVFMQFGYEGLGLFYTILEKIAKQEKPVKTEVLKKQLFVGKKLTKCWNFLEEIGLISTKNGETFNENLLKFSEKYQVSREKNRERIEKFRSQSIEIEEDKKNVTHYETITERSCNAPKVKISKVKESKENNIPAEVKKLRLDCREFFLQYYATVKGENYYWLAKDATALNSLLAKIKSKIIEKNGFSEEREIYTSYKLILENISDKWILDNYSIPNINSKFNEIIIQIKNKANGATTPTGRYDAAQSKYAN
jgi:hypothetical protein